MENDRFKFRAWSKVNKCFHYWGFGLAEMSFIGPPHVQGRLIDVEYQQQCTGLKDKNGKLIFEGDILKWISLILPITVSGFHGYRFMYGKDQLCKAYAEYGEVIGNIYENPELLEKVK